MIFRLSFCVVILYTVRSLYFSLSFEILFKMQTRAARGRALTVPTPAPAPAPTPVPVPRAIPTRIWSGIALLLGLLLVYAAQCVTMINVYRGVKEIAADVDYSMESRLVDSTSTSVVLQQLKEQNFWIDRPLVEKSIKTYLNRTNANGKYLVVYGGKGDGKSLLVDNCIAELSGVLKLVVSYVEPKEFIVEALMRRLHVKASDVPDISTFTKALSTRPSPGKLMTLVFEVERGGSSEQALGVQAVRSLAKEFATVCNVIAILSEANAVLEFGKDSTRESFLHVNGFTRNEALEYLHHRQLNLTDSDADYLFEQIGTAPSLLADVCDHILLQNFTLHAVVSNKLAYAERELLAFPYQPILAALKEHPEGVPLMYFHKAKVEGVDLSNPHAVGVGMKFSNAIMYDIEKGLYKCLTRAHQTALQTYDPIVTIV